MPTPPPPPDPTYTLKNMHPSSSMGAPQPSATIYLGGLLCLAFDKTNKNMCTVGANPAGGHNWKLYVRERVSGKDILTRDKTSPTLDSTIRIKVTGGTTDSGTNGALVYTGADVTLSAVEHRYRLLQTWVDMEGERGHTEYVAHDAGKLSPRFEIDDGLFCAYRLSSGEWKLEDSQMPTHHEVPLGKVALALAADIFLKSPDSKIEIIHADGITTCTNDKHEYYEIYITNNCSRPCNLTSIDFSDHYEVFKGAFGAGKIPFARKFNLVRADAIEGTCDPIFASITGYGDLTDRAPCMSVTVGGTKTIN